MLQTYNQYITDSSDPSNYKCTSMHILLMIVFSLLVTAELIGASFDLSNGLNYYFDYVCLVLYSVSFTKDVLGILYLCCRGKWACLGCCALLFTLIVIVLWGIVNIMLYAALGKYMFTRTGPYILILSGVALFLLILLLIIGPRKKRQMALLQAPMTTGYIALSPPPVYVLFLFAFLIIVGSSNHSVFSSTKFLNFDSWPLNFLFSLIE